jgi:hypothetical protein
VNGSVFVKLPRLSKVNYLWCGHSWYLDSSLVHCSRVVGVVNHP